MSFPNGLAITEAGIVLQAKAQTGTLLNFTKIQIGSGTYSGLPGDRTSLVTPEKDIAIERLQNPEPGKALVGGSFNNSGLVTGFTFKELGVFATDPDVGEILYCYGNAGTAGEYIPADSGGEVLEKFVNVITLVGSATNVSATINESLVYTLQIDFLDHVDDTDIHLSTAQATILSNTSGTNTGDETTTTLGSKINGAVAKTTPVDADMIGLMDSAASNVLKKLSWANIKATLKTYFDSLYGNMTNPMTTQGDIIYGGSSGTPARLAKGTAGKILTMNSSADAPEWADLPPSGMAIYRTSSAPTTSDNTGQGYNYGDHWINTSTQTIYYYFGDDQDGAVWLDLKAYKKLFVFNSGDWDTNISSFYVSVSGSAGQTLTQTTTIKLQYSISSDINNRPGVSSSQQLDLSEYRKLYFKIKHTVSKTIASTSTTIGYGPSAGNSFEGSVNIPVTVSTTYSVYSLDVSDVNAKKYINIYHSGNGGSFPYTLSWEIEEIWGGN